MKPPVAPVHESGIRSELHMAAAANRQPSGECEEKRPLPPQQIQGKKTLQQHRYFGVCEAYVIVKHANHCATMTMSRPHLEL